MVIGTSTDPPKTGFQAGRTVFTVAGAGFGAGLGAGAGVATAGLGAAGVG
jgi:hypothetical protein